MPDRRGYSLIEFIMVIVILGALVAIGAPLVMKAAEAWVYESQRKEMGESARLSMERMTREIRRIKNAASVISANSSSIEFVDSGNNTIKFDSSGTTLRRTENGTSNALADNISALTFTYYDASGAVITGIQVSPSLTNIRRVEIGLVFSLGGTQLNFKSQASPRNIT